MRKITKQAVNAFNANENFKLHNTQVITSGDLTVMYLYGHAIARKYISAGIVEITNAGWQTNTTRERLNGLPNVSINQKNWQWYLNGDLWDGNWTRVI